MTWSWLEQVELFAGVGFQTAASEPVAQLLRQRCDELGHPSSHFARVLRQRPHDRQAGPGDVAVFDPKENAVRAEIARQLDDWRIGEKDLALCGGARGADILFGEECLARGACLRLLLALPESEFIEASVRLPNGEGNWVDRFRTLLKKCGAVANQDDRLGPPPNREEVFARTNLWILNTARVQGGHTGRSLYALLVWDENPQGDGIGGTSDFARRVTQLGADIRVINPTRLQP